MQLFKNRQSMPYAVLELTNLTLGGPHVVTPDELAHASRVIQTLAPEACGLRTTLEKLLESAGQRKEAKAWGRSFVDAVLDAGARRPADWSEWADLADKHTIKRRRSFNPVGKVTVELSTAVLEYALRERAKIRQEAGPDPSIPHGWIGSGGGGGGAVAV